MALKDFRRWLTQLAPETTTPSNKQTRPMLGLQSLDVRCLPTVMHGVMLCDPPVVEQCHVSTVDPCHPSSKGSGGKGEVKGSSSKGSKGKASGGKCEVKGSSSKGSKGKASGGKGSNGKCDLWVNFPGNHEQKDDGHKPCGYGYEPVPPVCPPVTPPVVCPPVVPPVVCPPVVPPVVPPVCPPVVPPVVPPVSPPVTPPVHPPVCETKGSKGKAEAGKKSNVKAESQKASRGKGEAKKASSSKGSNGKGNGKNTECNFSVPNPKAHATKMLKNLYGIKS